MYNKVFQIYIHIYIYIFFFRVFLHVGYYKILSIVPCAIQYIIVGYLFSIYITVCITFTIF